MGQWTQFVKMELWTFTRDWKWIGSKLSCQYLKNFSFGNKTICFLGDDIYKACARICISWYIEGLHDKRFILYSSRKTIKGVAKGLLTYFMVYVFILATSLFCKARLYWSTIFKSHMHESCPWWSQIIRCTRGIWGFRRFVIFYRSDRDVIHILILSIMNESVLLLWRRLLKSIGSQLNMYLTA